MSEKDLNIKYICENTLLDKQDELVPVILEMITKSYVAGLNQAEYDNTMEIIEENAKLRKELEERPKEYVFIGNAQNKTRDFINNITKENTKLLKQQKEFIKYLKDEKDRLAREVSNIYEDSLGKTKIVNEDIFNKVNEILEKYKEIINYE